MRILRYTTYFHQFPCPWIWCSFSLLNCWWGEWIYWKGWKDRSLLLRSGGSSARKIRLWEGSNQLQAPIIWYRISFLGLSLGFRYISIPPNHLPFSSDLVFLLGYYKRRFLSLLKVRRALQFIYYDTRLERIKEIWLVAGLV